MITTSNALQRELNRQNDDFITVILNGEEYIIDSIVHVKSHGDLDTETHLAIKICDKKDGYLR